GYADGYTAGYENGTSYGFSSGYAAGYSDGSAAGFENGSAVAYAAGFTDGYEQGFLEGYASGYDDGYADGLEDGGGKNLSPGVPDTPHPALACSEPFHVQAAGWDVCWQQDDLRSQGVEINRAFFHNKSVMWKMGVPFSLTRYEKVTGPGPFKDTLGTPGAAGLPGFGLGNMVLTEDVCPRFLQDGRLLNGGRLCVEEMGGPEPAVAIWAKYNVFNYRMLQGWVFDSRGTIQPMVALGGQLIDGALLGTDGQNHFHHVYWRMDFDIAGSTPDTLQAFKHVSGEAPVVNTGEPFTQILDPIREATGLEGCESVKDITTTFWCDLPHETLLTYEIRTGDKWRVADLADLNAQGRPRSFEFVHHSDVPADEFSRFDVMLLQHKGDSTELGYEVVSVPSLGDDRIISYVDKPPQTITDPVIWVAYHAYHDTRDEDRGSMSMHYMRFDSKPRNFEDANPGERTFP
ncbi:MAG TPA: hypothetical protein VGB18_03325, partial [Candidatus Thermoplasmatota archaeon]